MSSNDDNSGESEPNNFKYFIDASKEILGISKTTKHAKLGMLISGFSIQCDNLMVLICDLKKKVISYISSNSNGKLDRSGGGPILSLFSEIVSHYNYINSCFLYFKLYFIKNFKNLINVDHVKKSIRSLEEQLISALQSINNVMRTVKKEITKINSNLIDKIQFVYNIIIKIDNRDNTQSKYMKEIEKIVKGFNDNDNYSNTSTSTSTSSSSHHLDNHIIDDCVYLSTDESDDSFMSSDSGNSSGGSQIRRFGRNQRNVMSSNKFDEYINLIMDDDNQ